jgi:hypothetical protein
MGVFGPENRVTGELVHHTYVDTARLNPNTQYHPARRHGWGSVGWFGLDFVDTFRDSLDPILSYAEISHMHSQQQLATQVYCGMTRAANDRSGGKSVGSQVARHHSPSLAHTKSSRLSTQLRTPSDYCDVMHPHEKV